MCARSYHHGNLRSALLARAEETVRERGVAALSLRELARETGVSHGAPRRHFGDRQALLDALAEEGFVRLGQDLDDAVRDAEPDCTSRLKALSHAYVRFATRHAALLELMYAGKHREGAESVHAAAERAFAVALGVIADAQKTGELVPGDPESLAQVALATLHGLTAMSGSGMLEGQDLETVVPDAVEKLLYGLRRR
ncbi:TetR/AcrR family transcriptional regulator [Streptomyces marispadix]|uniref:TetR/AcrR family transcriptional regulator n=1 Tax=Streptomyces marispadix TaxID=2922868 RepID=A0ABS9T382_9ACTN|nr:TetR/AcrR family transcriptional regulator [Streptomyces marispadix]MCH6163004.1 TetR/AcrR family transcriptional regulator [Streptomyces marispadix]